MVKITVKIKESAEDNTCIVSQSAPKDLSKVSQVEKNCLVMVQNKIKLALDELAKN